MPQHTRLIEYPFPECSKLGMSLRRQPCVIMELQILIQKLGRMSQVNIQVRKKTGKKKRAWLYKRGEG